MKIYTEEQILVDEEWPDFAIELSEQGQIHYSLTEDEQQWLDFIRGRYDIADYIDQNTDENNITLFDAMEFSEALENDCRGFGKAVCLSDDTALQRIFFYGYIEPER